MCIRLSITTLDDVLGLKNAGDLFRLHFSFVHIFHPIFRTALTAAPVAAVALVADTQRVPYRRTAYL